MKIPTTITVVPIASPTQIQNEPLAIVLPPLTIDALNVVCAFEASVTFTLVPQSDSTNVNSFTGPAYAVVVEHGIEFVHRFVRNSRVNV